MDIAAVIDELEALLERHTLLEEEHAGERVEALSFLDFAIQALHGEHRRRALNACGTRAQARAEQLRRSLQAVDQRLFDHVRAEIIAGHATHRPLRPLLDRYTGYPGDVVGYQHYRFDGLDAVVAGVLQAHRMPEPTRELCPEMISYQATPASVILELVDRVDLGPGDVFFDIGSGLGHVVILVALLAGVRATGVEIEPAYCAHARHQASALGLSSSVSFISADARDADYGEGTIFYLYTPFTGRVLAEVLARLRDHTLGRPVLLCSYGPCTPIIAQEPWLRSLDNHVDSELKLALFAS